MLGLTQVLRKETVVGVDFGSRLMKVCYAEPNGPDRWRVTRTSFAPTPKDAIRDGVIMDRGAVATALRELLRSANLSHITGANAAIAGASVIVRHVKMPRMTEAALRKSIPYEAAKHISTSIDDSTIEFEIIGPVAGEPDKMNVMLVAAPNEMINSRLETIELAGLEPVAIDVEAFAVQHALLEIGKTAAGKGETIAILDIGASATDVTIITNGFFALTRNISLAGDQFTNAIKNAKQCSFDDAEELKQTVDMSALLSPDADPDQQAAAKMVQPALDELLREVRRSINYYQSQVGEGALILPANPDDEAGGEEEPGAVRRPALTGQVSKLVITGGSALLRGLKPYMEVRLGATVEHWNIFENSAIDSAELAPSFIDAHHSLFALCTGLAVKPLKKAAPVKTGLPAPKAKRADRELKQAA